jgi:hypothetical protein
LTLEKLDKYIYIYKVKKILLKCKEKKVILKKRKKRMESGKEEDACHIEKVTVGSVTKVQKKMLSSGRGHD